MYLYLSVCVGLAFPTPRGILAELTRRKRGVVHMNTRNFYGGNANGIVGLRRVWVFTHIDNFTLKCSLSEASSHLLVRQKEGRKIHSIVVHFFYPT